MADATAFLIEVRAQNRNGWQQELCALLHGALRSRNCSSAILKHAPFAPLHQIGSERIGPAGGRRLRLVLFFRSAETPGGCTMGLCCSCYEAHCENVCDGCLCVCVCVRLVGAGEVSLGKCVPNAWSGRNAKTPVRFLCRSRGTDSSTTLISLTERRASTLPNGCYKESRNMRKRNGDAEPTHTHTRRHLNCGVY
ncbi:hypothetical protein DQ04_07491010 [Trypanosoma grayi]|uniref:hypothetical protein n=1 Tax=Trypanosoma grayi TaxID=71804 RepID=UPI0004F47D01|nr:hypothetical protein DQ04_07491010 [Trypanosoma grayi]KEG08300.1 hypothetical protein DQ04_07491010 [Trypanosoma grayi]